MFEDIKGKVAVVTGASRGIGRALAEGYAKAGADVVVAARNVPREMIDFIEAYGVKCHAFHFDFSECEKIPELVERILETCGTIDILYNNAGTQKRYLCEEFPMEEWDYVMNVNSKSVYFMCQAVGRHMLEKGRGKIINMASLLSYQGGLHVPAYASSKGSVMQFTKSLSNEWAGRGVNVNGIAPGYIATDLNTALIADEVRSRQILERIPAGRWGRPEDIVGTALFLSSSASDYVNGIVIPVDGGWLGR